MIVFLAMFFEGGQTRKHCFLQRRQNIFYFEGAPFETKHFHQKLTMTKGAGEGSTLKGACEHINH